MIIPAELTGRVCKTRLSSMINLERKLSEIQKEFPVSEIDVVYENLRPIIVLVFESTEDCLAFKLKYGNEYV